MAEILDLTVPRFFVAVEQVVSPGLKSRAVAVAAPAPGGRGLVLCVSAEAEASGVQRGLMAQEAKRRCKSLVLLPPRFSLYRRASHALLMQALRLTPQVEAAGTGHLFADLSASQRLFGPAEDCAASLRKSLLSQTRLCTALGLARNKVTSRAASGVAERFGLCRVEAGHEARFLAPLPVTALMGLGEKSRSLLQGVNVTTAGQVAQLPEAQLISLLGKQGKGLPQKAQGLGDACVRSHGQPAQLVTVETVLAPDSNDYGVLRRALFLLAQDLGQRLRQQRSLAEALDLVLLYTDGIESSRRMVLEQASDLELEFWPSLQQSLEGACSRRLRVSRLTLSAHLGLENAAAQLCFWSAETRQRKLTQAMDALRLRCGPKALQFGLGLGIVAP
jgi:DNA polymerase-4